MQSQWSFSFGYNIFKLKLYFVNYSILFHVMFFCRFATHQKVENSLTFEWPLNSFHWPLSNEKQSIFTFALALFAGHQYFSLHFRPLSAEREEGFGTQHSQRKPLTTCQVYTVKSLCLLCSILHLFQKKNCILTSWRKLTNYKPENRIPWLFTDFDNIKAFPRFFKKFPDFSLTLKSFRFFLTFPWSWPWHPPHLSTSLTMCL